MHDDGLFIWTSSYKVWWPWPSRPLECPNFRWKVKERLSFLLFHFTSWMWVHGAVTLFVFSEFAVCVSARLLLSLSVHICVHICLSIYLSVCFSLSPPPLSPSPIPSHPHFPSPSCLFPVGNTSRGELTKGKCRIWMLNRMQTCRVPFSWNKQPTASSAWAHPWCASTPSTWFWLVIALTRLDRSVDH